MAADDSATQLLEQIEHEQASLRIALSSHDSSLLALRPQSGKWSVIENLRHLLFAEQLHLGRFGARPVAWSLFGFNPETMRLQRKLPPVDASFALEEVLAAWEAVHADLRPSLQDDTAEVLRALERNLLHLRRHVKEIDRLLRAHGR
jgi:hypothetical protein